MVVVFTSARCRGDFFVFEIMDYGSHGQDSLDEMKENPFFILTMLRNLLATYLAAATGPNGDIERKLGKMERHLMRLAIRHNRIIRSSKAAKELELHKEAVMKYCRRLVEKGKFLAIPSGISGRVYPYEYLGSTQSPDLI